MNESTLMLHCGGQLATREQIASVQTPDATDSWRPVPHIRLIEEVESSLANFQMRIVESAFALAQDGRRFFGLMQVAMQTIAENKDYGLMISLRNAHDKKWRVLMGVGSRVFICDNLAMSAEIQVFRKHTSHVLLDLPNLVGRATGQLAERWNDQATRIEAYKNHELSDSQANDLIVRAYEGGVAPITVLPDVIKEWKTPRHPEFAERKNMWRFFNGVTESLKGNIWALPKRTQALHALCDTQVGLLGRETSLKVNAN
jgi:hypothetical protein